MGEWNCLTKEAEEEEEEEVVVEWMQMSVELWLEKEVVCVLYVVDCSLFSLPLSGLVANSDASSSPHRLAPLPPTAPTLPIYLLHDFPPAFTLFHSK